MCTSARKQVSRNSGVLIPRDSKSSEGSRTVMTGPVIHKYIQQRVDLTAFDVKWMPQSAKFLAFGACPDGQGTVNVYELDGCSVNKTQQLTHPRGVKCGTFASSSREERNVTTGGFDGNWRIWDVEHPSQPVVCIRGHSKIINSVDGIGDTDGSPAVVTGCKDGSVKVWDPRKPEQPTVVMEPAPEQQKLDCWAVCFGNGYSAVERCVCAGYENGDIKFFDLRNLAVTWETCVKSGVCSLEFDQKSIYMNKLVATGTGSNIHVFDLRTKHPKRGFAQLSHSDETNSTIWAARHLPQDRDIFATCAGSGTINLWKYQYPDKRTHKASDGCDEGVAGTLTHLCKASLGNQPVSALDWNPDMQGLFATCTFDQTLHVGFVTGLAS